MGDNQKGAPIRVLHITEMLSAAGIESFIMNLYRRIDRSAVQFDFLVLRNEHEFYDDEIKSLGGKKYWVHSEKKNTLARILDEARQIEKFLKHHKYNIVHIHYTTPLRAPYLLAAKRAGVQIRIYHAHSAYVSGKSPIKLMIYDFMRGKISKWATHYFACSEAAAEWIFERKLIQNAGTKVVYNGIDVQRFSFDLQERDKVREELKLENRFVLIHTGRFTEQKNHRFVISVFSELKKKCPEAALVLLGTGELMDDMVQLAKEKGLHDDVFFMGVQSAVNRYLSGADCYIMPSYYEGLPVAAVEAQCAGLPCVFSENVTREVALIEHTAFLSLEEPICNWVDQILAFKNCQRCDQSSVIKQNGYDVQTVADEMEQFYLNSGKGQKA